MNAYEIGLSIALDNGLSASLDQAEQQVARLTKALASRSLDLQTVRSAGAEASSVATHPGVRVENTKPASVGTRTLSSIPWDAAFRPVAYPARGDAGEKGVGTAWLHALKASLAPQRRQAGEKDAEAARFHALQASVAAQSERPAAHGPVPEQSSVSSQPPHVPDTPGTTTPGLASHVQTTSSVCSPVMKFDAPVVNPAETRQAINPLATWIDVPALSSFAPAERSMDGMGAPNTEFAPLYAVASPGGVFPQDGTPAPENTAFPGGWIIAERYAGMGTDLQRPAAGPPLPSSPGAWTSITAPITDNEDWGIGRDTGRQGTQYGKFQRDQTRCSEAGRATRDDASGGNVKIEGDVFLDGTLIGRWMSRYLNDQANRANSGPTGYDGRRGQILPGVVLS